MLKIRLVRIGKKNQPNFRLVVTTKTAKPKGGRFLEMLGFYNPRSKEKKFKAERIKYWISQGAQLSDTVHNLLVDGKIIEGPKRKVKVKAKRKTPLQTDQPETDEKPEKTEEKENVETHRNASLPEEKVGGENKDNTESSQKDTQ